MIQNTTTETSLVPPPPPPLTSTTTKQQTKPTTATSIVLVPTTNDLNNAITKLKKPKTQHIVGFKERYQQALLMNDDDDDDNDNNLYFNRKFIYSSTANQWIRLLPPSTTTNESNHHTPSCCDEQFIKKYLSEMIEFPNNTGRKLKIITLNTWFAKILQFQRYSEQLKCFEELNADVICLQEVIPEYIEEFITINDFIKSNYIISDINGNSVHPYGVMLLIKKNLPLLEIRITKLTSRMGRCLITCSFTKNLNLNMYNEYIEYLKQSKNGKSIQELNLILKTFAVIGTVHLESLSSRDRRAVQLNEIYQIFKFYDSNNEIVSNNGNSENGNCKLKMLMGDFNFDSSSRENQQLSTGGLFSSFIDIWPYLYPKKEGKTFLYHSKKGDRLDRMLIYSNEYIPKEMKIIGNEKLKLSENDQLKLTESFNMESTCMSDHFGLYCEIECNDDDQQQ